MTQKNPVSGSSATLTGCKLIVVEDHSDTRQMMTFVLEQNGASVRATDSVTPALQMFEEQHPDIVVADISMAGLNGYALISEVRRINAEGGFHTPVIAVTAFASPQDRELAMSAGFDRYIVKPINLHELIQAIVQLWSGATESPGS
jgi:CheY-like chemotaxis protein